MGLILIILGILLLTRHRRMYGSFFGRPRPYDRPPRGGFYDMGHGPGPGGPRGPEKHNDFGGPHGPDRL